MKKILALAVIVSCLMCAACKKDGLSAYKEMESKELAKGIRNDDLFFGVHFGMSMEDFYSHCYELNRQKILREGAGNMTAQYRMDTTEMKYVTYMDFYPKFYLNKIYYMPVTFQYMNWNPYDKKYSPENLQVDVLKYMEKKYGQGFIKVVDPSKGRVFVKVDGNRRISITMDIERDVLVKIVDLTVAKQLGEMVWKDEW